MVSDVDAVLSAYSNRQNLPINRAIILELGDWKSGMSATQELISDLFRAKSLLVISALSSRLLTRV